MNKSRQRCNCDIETGHHSTTSTLIANIAHKMKAYLEWDRKTERFTNHPAANKYLIYPYRAPYQLPQLSYSDRGTAGQGRMANCPSRTSIVMGATNA